MRQYQVDAFDLRLKKQTIDHGQIKHGGTFHQQALAPGILRPVVHETLRLGQGLIQGLFISPALHPRKQHKGKVAPLKFLTQVIQHQIACAGSNIERRR